MCLNNKKKQDATHTTTSTQQFLPPSLLMKTGRSLPELADPVASVCVYM